MLSSFHPNLSALRLMVLGKSRLVAFLALGALLLISFTTPTIGQRPDPQSLHNSLPSWFRALDKDLDGQISLEEWLKSGKKRSDFRKYDLNDDGLITAEELLRSLRRPIHLKLKDGQANYGGMIEEAAETYRGKKCYQIFTIKLDFGKIYQIDHISNAFDAYLYLEDFDGAVLAEDDDGGEGLNSRIVFRTDHSGFYRLIATSVGNSRPGAFSFSVRVLKPPGRTLPKGLPAWFKALDKDKDGQINVQEWRQGGKKLAEFRDYDLNDDGLITAEEVLRSLNKPVELRISEGQAKFQGTIEESVDSKYRGKKSFKLLTIQLEQGKTYQVDHISPKFQAFLYLEDSDGRVLKENSSRNIGDNSRIVFRAEHTGLYRLVATSLGGFRTGDFSLSVYVLERTLPKGLPAWFQDLDRDGTGQVALREWLQAGKESSEFRKYDLNDDGFITVEEVLRYLKRSVGRTLPKGLPSWFADLDKDGDGQISLHEWLQSGRKAGDFRDYDLNGDGLITPEEVLRYLKKPVDLKLRDGEAKYTGTIEETADESCRGKNAYKVFTIKMERGKSYQIDFRSDVFQAVVYLEDREGNLLKEHSSRKVGDTSRIMFLAEKVGTYRVIATSESGTATGECLLSVRYSRVPPKGLPSWFQELDREGVGQITLQQWLQSGKEIKEFRQFDLNDDGLITAEEVLRCLKK